MSEDKPNYDSQKIRYAAKVREVLRISATLEKSQVAREIILEWLENDASTELPEAAWKGDPFHHEAKQPLVYSNPSKRETSDTWALRFVASEAGETEQLWTTEIATRDQSGQESLFSVRTLVKSTERNCAASRQFRGSWSMSRASVAWSKVPPKSKRSMDHRV